MDQGSLGDGVLQGGGLAESDLFTGIAFEAFHVPVQGGIVIEGGDATA